MGKQYAHIKATGAIREVVHIIAGSAGPGYVLRAERSGLSEEIYSEQLLDLLPENSVSEEVASKLLAGERPLYCLTEHDTMHYLNTFTVYTASSLAPWLRCLSSILTDPDFEHLTVKYSETTYTIRTEYPRPRAAQPEHITCSACGAALTPATTFEYAGKFYGPDCLPFYDKHQQW